MLDADLFVVLTGCIPDLVGDDVGSVVRDRSSSAACRSCSPRPAAFTATTSPATSAVTRAIIDQFVGDYASARVKGTVNVWSLLPYHNTFWRGDLTEIKRLLDGDRPRGQHPVRPGIRPASANGRHPERPVQPGDRPLARPRNRAPSRSANTGSRSCMCRRCRSARGETDRLSAPTSPPSPGSTRAGEDVVDAFIADEEARYYKYIEDFTDFYSEYWWGLPARFAVIGDARLCARPDQFPGQPARPHPCARHRHRQPAGGDARS